MKIRALFAAALFTLVCQKPTLADSPPFNAFSVSSLGGQCGIWGTVLFQSQNGVTKCLGVGTNGQVLISHGSNADLGWNTVTGTGTVTSIAASVPPFMTVAGGPITGGGTLEFSFNSEAANLVFASPDGAAGTPVFRALTADDIPAIPSSSVIFPTETANTFFAAPNGSAGTPAFRSLALADIPASALNPTNMPFTNLALPGTAQTSVNGKLQSLGSSVSDFATLYNDGTTDNTAAFSAADASGGVLSLPAGRYNTTFAGPTYQLINSVYKGPGQIIIGGYAQAPFRSIISTPLPTPSPNRYQAFDGGCLHQYRCSYAEIYGTINPYNNFTGDGTTTVFTTSYVFPASYPLSSMAVGVAGNLQSGTYTIVQNANNTMTVTFNTAPANGASITISENYQTWLQYSTDREIVDWLGGFNADPLNQNIGRSGAAMHSLEADHGGQGDYTMLNLSCNVYSSRPGATSIFAEPACSQIGGSMTAEADGVYLQPQIGGEVLIQDGGHSAAVATVSDYVRNGGGTSLGQVWIGWRPQSSGAYPLDAVVAPAGNVARGFDLTPTNLDANQGALNLKAGQRVYFNAVADPNTIDGGIQWFATTYNSQYTDYNSTTGAMETINGTGTFNTYSSGATGTIGPSITLQSCGTSPTVTDANSSRGTISVGSSATGCIIAFPTALPKRPICTVTSESGIPFAYATSTVAINLANTTGNLSGTKIDYKCEL